MTTKKLIVATFGLAIASAPVHANELIFQFTNPNFGGNPLNAQFLFGLAEAQRTATANDLDDAGGAGAAGGDVTGGGGIGGPTIIIPITTGDGGAPVVGTPTGGGQPPTAARSSAFVPQISN